MHRKCYAVFLAMVMMGTSVCATQIVIKSREDQGGAGSDRHNFKIGELALDLGYEIEVDYDDNTNRSSTSTSRDEGTRISNGINVGVDWPLNPHLRIDSAMTIGYISYLGGNGSEGFFIAGDEGSVTGNVALDMRFGQDGLVVIDNTISRDLDTIEISRQANAEEFSLWSNNLSAQYQNKLSQYWDIAFKIARIDTWAAESQFEFRDNTAYAVDGLFNWAVNSSLTIAPYARFETTDYHEDDTQGARHNDVDLYEFGISSDYILNSTTVVGLLLGYQILDIDTSNNPLATDEKDGVVAEFDLQHQLSDVVTQSFGLSFRRTVGTSTFINYSDDLLARYDLSWTFTTDWEFFGGFEWLKTNESGDGEIGEVFRQNAGLRYEISPKSSLTLAYQRSEKFSNLNNQGYERNQYGAQFLYDF